MEVFDIKQKSLDITGAEIVEISVRCDGKVIWINVDGVCKLRICKIYKVVVNDERPEKLKR